MQVNDELKISCHLSDNHSLSERRDKLRVIPAKGDTGGRALVSGLGAAHHAPRRRRGQGEEGPGRGAYRPT